MQDFVFVPSHVLPLIFSQAISWSSIESLITLLSVCPNKRPVERFNGFSRYIMYMREVRPRFDEKSHFRDFKFHHYSKNIPFIDRFQSVHYSHEYKCISYWVHDLCNPTFYEKQCKKMAEFDAFPVKLWKMPRHVLIRWRYSARLPMHKSNFHKGIPCSYEIDEECGLNALQTLDELSRCFYSIMCSCDESSLSYGFLCTFFFRLHDDVISAVRKDHITQSLILLLQRTLKAFSEQALTQRHPNDKVYELEGQVRGFMPKAYFNTFPLSAFSTANAV